jgi:hypothetical protein
MISTSVSAETRRHPLMRGTYAIYTPPISDFFDTVCEWIDGHVTGGYIFGPPRQGKSRAVQFWIERLLTERYGPLLPFFRMNQKSHDRFSEVEFLTELLGAGGHRYAQSGSRGAKLDRLVKLYATRARNSGSSLVVLMIDEAQNLRDASYRTLCNLQNELDELGVQLIVISVGTQELVYQHSAFVQGGDMHLVGRFMMREALFRGIIGAAELGFVLRAYDEGTEWPQGSGTSYTRFFFPSAFEAGFRLSPLASDLWGVFEEMAPPKMRPQLSVAMEHVAKSVEAIIRTLAGDAAAIKISREVLVRAVASTRYPSYMQAMAALPGNFRHVN